MTAALWLRWLHVLAAVTWIGGMAFIALTVVPVLRQLEDEALRARLMRALGLRFRTVAWAALALLGVTGLANLWLRPYLLGSPVFLHKLGLVAAALGLSLVHDFVAGPRAGRGGADAVAWRTRAIWLARANALVAAGVVLLGLALRG